MIKRYCDVCGKEVDRSVSSDRFRPSDVVGGVRVDCEIMVSINGVWNAGDLCVDCLKAIVEKGQERELPLKIG